MRNIWVFSKYCVCVVVPEKKFSRILEDEGWKNCADFFVGMNAATSLQTSRVCCREKDFPPSPPSILHILFFIYLYRLLQLLYGVCYFYMSLCDGEFYGSSFFYTEASKVSSILVSRSRKPFCVLLCIILWTRLWVVSCAHVYWWSKLRLAHYWETNNQYLWEIYEYFQNIVFA